MSTSKDLHSRGLIKGVAASLLHHGGIRRAVNAVRRFQAGGRRVTIVNYHRVVESFEDERTRALPPLLPGPARRTAPLICVGRAARLSECGPARSARPRRVGGPSSAKQRVGSR